MTNTAKPAKSQPQAIAADLIAVLVAVIAGEPHILTIRDARALPSGPFVTGHRSLQSGLRAWVEAQTGHPIGYMEQLYTFADRDRTEEGRRAISISYLGLTRADSSGFTHDVAWRNWYGYFPWEDHRNGEPEIFTALLMPRLRKWAQAADSRPAREERWQRAAITFGFDDEAWNEELVLQRYELLYEAGLVPEAVSDANAAVPGLAMQADHRRILATGIARLRAKIKYRPVVFELMPEAFSLLQLQKSVEALAGRLLHKQNFRRLIEQQELVEETGKTSFETGGRPAKLFRFRQAVLAERAAAGTKLPLLRP
ncbi:NUDIX hydrolase [Taklimakanibacter deserti]|uniref:NUDIX hydrolase n=1 Tax=Taklimakanibacter deserti TaxID=2267839 RepID=UPI000E64788C